jgi:hypothetical protein
MINEKALKAYLLKEFSGVKEIHIKKLGSGVQGAGFLVEMKTGEEIRSYVVKALRPEHFGHDYPSDRAGVFLLDLDEYKTLPRHVKAVDVLSEMEDGSIKSIGGGKDYYLFMERGAGKHYFHDLTALSQKTSLDILDIKRIKALTSYLAEIHSVKNSSKTLYWRKLRDTVGHGECLMGVFDIYPDGILSSDETTGIIKKSVDWIYRLKPYYKRLSQIHGDFHPGNIWFTPPTHPLAKGETGGEDFILLDRSRGPWGEPADDVTALTINYIFFSVKNYEDIRGPYLEALHLFFEEYIKSTGDTQLLEVVAPFFAFRGVVVANPVFYPELTSQQRGLLFSFVNNVLDADRFEFQRVHDYLK